jgi:ribosomal protein S14
MKTFGLIQGYFAWDEPLQKCRVCFRKLAVDRYAWEMDT